MSEQEPDLDTDLEKRIKKLESQNRQLRERLEGLEDENKRLKRVLEENLEVSSEKKMKSRSFSRREFIKKLGAGAAGLGALSFLPASASLKLTKNSVFRDGSPAFLDLSGSNSMNGNLDMGGKNLTNSGSISANRADITNETLVSGYMGSNKSISADTWTNLTFDNIQKDERGEYDTSNYQFSPDETGWYIVNLGARFTSHSSGDRIALALRNTGTRFMKLDIKTAGSRDEGLSISSIVKLDSGSNYEFWVRNKHSSCSIQGNMHNTYLTVRSAFR